jgi:hypothetical protein
LETEGTAHRRTTQPLNGEAAELLVLLVALVLRERQELRERKTAQHAKLRA